MIDLSLSEKERTDLTEDEIEIAMARKLELLSLPHLRRNMRFFYAGGDLKGKAEAYRKEMDQQEFEQAINENGNLATVCKPLCDMMANILKENGIEAEPVSCDTDIFKHTDVMITTKSGKKYIINYLEDMEYIQTGMKTPDFASKPYYDRRYKKFEGSVTTNGKSIDGTEFISEDRLAVIDKNLGYRRYNIYMDYVIDRLQQEFSNFRKIMEENEILNKKFQAKQEGQEISEDEVNSIHEKYQNMTKEEELEQKLDWIFQYFNQRRDIKGHADFVMYYSRLLLKKVLSPEEYNKITRYDGFLYKNNIPDNCSIKNVLDFENQDSKNKLRFCLLDTGNKVYVFSTLANEYAKLNQEEFNDLKEYSIVSKSEKPSDLVLGLCDRGNALPLVFHPLGGKILNERAELISKDLSEEQRTQETKKLVDSIITTDVPVTSILIPYPDKTEKYLYINKDDEFVVRQKGKETVYHYNEETDDFYTEDISLEDR